MKFVRKRIVKIYFRNNIAVCDTIGHCCFRRSRHDETHSGTQELNSYSTRTEPVPNNNSSITVELRTQPEIIDERVNNGESTQNSVRLQTRYISNENVESPANSTRHDNIYRNERAHSTICPDKTAESQC